MVFLTQDERILIKMYDEGTLTSNDVQTILDNCTVEHASSRLVKLWRKGDIKRVRIHKKKKGGKKYKYHLSEQGEKRALWLIQTYRD